MRGAPSAKTPERASARRAPPLQIRHVSGAPRTSSSTVAAQNERPKAGRPDLPVGRAARSSDGAGRAV